MTELQASEQRYLYTVPNRTTHNYVTQPVAEVSVGAQGVHQVCGLLFRSPLPQLSENPVYWLRLQTTVAEKQLLNSEACA
jgi:hypothetical protein